MYTLNLSNGIVIRDADGVQVAPVDSANNSDFIAYNDWVHAGNQPTIIQMSQADLDATNALAIANNIATLWESAHSYEYSSINGVAIGLLAIGVLKGGPVSLSIAGWSAAIWNLYYQRKSTITAIEDPSLNDFSLVGPMPHSITELRIELGF